MLPSNWARRLKTQESLQRAICRGMLLTCALLPVALTLALTLHWQLPWTRSAFARALDAHIATSSGLLAHSEGAKYVSPRCLRIAKLQLRHPETQEVILDGTNVVVNQLDKVWFIELQDATLDSDLALSLSSLTHEWFLCRTNDSLPPLHISAKRATIISQAKPMSTGRLLAKFLPGQETSSFVLQFEPEALGTVAAKEPASPIRMIVNRQRDSKSRNTTLQIVTSEHLLPTSLLYHHFPSARQLGPDAMFSGTFAMVLDGQYHSMALSKCRIVRGRWEDITANLGYHVSGEAEVFVEDAKVVDGRIERLAGGIFGKERGNFSTEWIYAAINSFDLRYRNGAFDGSGAVHPYSEFSIWFQLDASGLKLSGGLKPPQDNYPMCFLADSEQLLYEPPEDKAQTPVSIDRLVNWLSLRPKQFAALNGVQQASYQTDDDSARSSAVSAAYLSTMLPNQDRITQR